MGFVLFFLFYRMGWGNPPRTHEVYMTEDVFCPICSKKYNRKKLLLKKHKDAKGEIIVWCKGCKKEVEIVLDSEKD